MSDLQGLESTKSLHYSVGLLTAGDNGLVTYLWDLTTRPTYLLTCSCVKVHRFAFRLAFEVVKVDADMQLEITQENLVQTMRPGGMGEGAQMLPGQQMQISLHNPRQMGGPQLQGSYPPPHYATSSFSQVVQPGTNSGFMQMGPGAQTQQPSHLQQYVSASQSQGPFQTQQYQGSPAGYSLNNPGGF